MRGFLGFLVFSATLIAMMVFVAGPVVARPLVADLVRSALPFDGSDLVVEIDVDGFDLLGGHVREIRVSGDGLVADDVTIGSLSLTARRVGLLSRDAADLTGRIGDLTVTLAGGRRVTVASVDILGGSASVAATAHLAPAAAEALVASALADAGLAVDRIVLTDGGFDLELLGQRITLALAVADGAVVLPSITGGDPVMVLTPGAGNSWRITALTMSGDGLEIEAAIDAAALLGRGGSPASGS